MFLQRLASRTIDDVRGGKITVMGVLETRNISFDGVIIVDFNDNHVPKKSDKDIIALSQNGVQVNRRNLYKTVTKIKNTLDKLSKTEIKNKVLEAIGSQNSSAYEEFLAQTKGQITKFNKVIYKFKKKSYQFYILFSFLGLAALFVTASIQLTVVGPLAPPEQIPANANA